MPSNGEAQIRCYYEVLGVERKATYDEIRAAYKRQALALHPDKNHGNVEAAAEQFKEVQNAYAVLSDEKERAWYDAHRESILSGDGDGTCAPDEINLFPYFSAKCFAGFDDADPNSFYAVYRRVFDTLIAEEEAHDARARQWPRFGASDTAADAVAAFYRQWKNFSSFKTFAWKDEYKTNEIPDRATRRAAERINAKVRLAAKKEYVLLVSELAEFVQRRDPRVTAQRQRAEEEERAKEEVRAVREAEAAKRRRERNEKLWVETARIEQEEAAARAERGEDDNGSILEALYEKQRALERRKKQRGQSPPVTVGRADDCVLTEERDERYRVHESQFRDDDEEDAAEAQRNAPTTFSCPLCRKSFNNPAQFAEHNASAKHKAKARQQQAKQEASEAAKASVEGESSARPAPRAAAADAAKAGAPVSSVSKHQKPKHVATGTGERRPPSSSSGDEDDGDDSSPTSHRNAFAAFAQSKRRR